MANNKSGLIIGVTSLIFLIIIVLLSLSIYIMTKKLTEQAARMMDKGEKFFNDGEAALDNANKFFAGAHRLIQRIKKL